MFYWFVLEEIVVVDIDVCSLDKFGVWLFFCRFYVEFIDRLVVVGVIDIVFDIDFSVSFNFEDDLFFV